MALYHYTNLDALTSIIQNNELWFTHINYMNDSQELYEGLDKIVDRWLYKRRLKRHIKSTQLNIPPEDLRKEFEAMWDNRLHREIYRESEAFLEEIEKFRTNCNIFVMSFSESSDLLSQWRGYSNLSQGYCIEFDEGRLNEQLNRQQKMFNADESMQFSLQQCMYSDETSNKLIEEHSDKLMSKEPYDLLEINEDDFERYYAKYDIQSNLVEDKHYAVIYEKVHNLLSNILITAANIKNNSFREEKEKRAAIYLSNECASRVSYRNKNGVLIPFFKLPITENVIESITLGPGPNAELAAASLAQYLTQKFENADVPKVHISETPFRDSL
ncbi:DUF2971 domain-containing protein [Agaribacter marinus]|uniref:DUF2971 domain-containing protein n=1 Tax=Agaribacter marinus TaxID=1431249 RepID=A0AA37WIM9_9ALTE|nr:DUF2971 domain-containing protein [Agaribacter marinus]GLR71298.1 hypothetical protein GCM10007852_22060 [Agaribacter marinus]